MNCIGFPKMFKGNSTIVRTDDLYEDIIKDPITLIPQKIIIHNAEATRECLYLLLGSERRELFGDPDFGVMIKKFTFNQNNYILKDILIDEIYTQVRTFCPQVYLERNNISIKQVENKLYATITYKNKKDFTTNTIELALMNIGEDN